MPFSLNSQVGKKGRLPHSSVATGRGLIFHKEIIMVPSLVHFLHHLRQQREQGLLVFPLMSRKVFAPVINLFQCFTAKALEFSKDKWCERLIDL